MSISSFGEDEQGEVYVVDLNGSVSRIARRTTTCTYSISPTRATYPASVGSGTINVTTEPGCTWTASSNSLWINRYRRQRHRHRNGHLHRGAVRRKAEEAKRLDDGGRTESYDPAVEVIVS
jgi:hypothetical protein